MPLKTFLINIEAADEIRYRVDSFARRTATSLASIKSYYERPLGEKIGSRSQELTDRAGKIQGDTELNLRISHAVRDELPAVFTTLEIARESGSKAPTVDLTWLGERSASLPTHELTRKADDLQKGVHDISCQNVILKQGTRKRDMETIQILSKHMGTNIPLFLWHLDGNLHLFDNSKLIELGEDYLPTLFATAFMQTSFNEIVGLLNDRDEIKNLIELFQSEILNMEDYDE